MKRIAIFGDCNSIWVKTYVNEVFESSSKIEIYIFSEKKPLLNCYSSYGNNVKIINCYIPAFLNRVKIGFALYILKIAWVVFRVKKFDYFHIHFVNLRKLLLVNFLKKFSMKVIVTFWGSDLLRKTNQQIATYFKYLENVNIITVGSNEMFRYAAERFPNDLLKKISIVRFGVSGLECICRFFDKKEELRNKWNFSKNKIIISIGYNGSSHQNHLCVLDCLIELSESLKEKIHIVLPMTYGLESTYFEKVKRKLDDSGFTYSILLDYMNSENIAKLCLSVDCFIHAQDTDALSASVQEYLCAGALVFNPEWIRYSELENKNVYYISYKSYEELKNEIVEFVSKGLTKEKKNRLFANRKIMYELSSWSILKNRWIKIYE